MSVPPIKIEEDLDKELNPPPSPPEQTGLVNTVASQARPAPAEPQAPAPTPAPAAAPTESVNERLNVQPDLVSDRVNELTAGGNRYVEQARKEAIRQANTRGLINTNMAGSLGVDAAIRNALPIAQQDAQATNRFLENRQSADLNIELARIDNELRKDFELTMNDARFSDEVKLQYVNTINNIMRDAQAQIVEIGMSDRSATAQANAIKKVEENRNAAIAVYQDLLNGFNDWDWGTDFTPAEKGEPGYQRPNRSAGGGGVVEAAASTPRTTGAPYVGTTLFGGGGGNR